MRRRGKGLTRRSTYATKVLFARILRCFHIQSAFANSIEKKAFEGHIAGHIVGHCFITTVGNCFIENLL